MSSFVTSPVPEHLLSLKHPLLFHTRVGEFFYTVRNRFGVLGQRTLTVVDPDGTTGHRRPKPVTLRCCPPNLNQ